MDAPADDPRLASLPPGKRPTERRPFRRYLGRSAAQRRIFVARDALWLVEGQYTETYRRLGFADIQLILWRPNQGRAIALTILGLALLLIGLLSAGNIGFDDGGLIFLLFMGLPGAVLLGRVIWVGTRGGYCRTFLTTAVQQAEVPIIDTRAKLDRFLKEVGGVIDAFQNHPERAEGREKAEV